MGHAWARGYVTDVTYSHGYFHELAPSFIRFCLLLQGLDHAGGEDDAQGRYHYCELGYGQGVSANLHAAANPRGHFWGTDFNPDHALFARTIAARAGVQAQWSAQSFSDLIDEPLPQFDCITLHGVWSWVDDTTRAALVEFLRRQLKVGGVVYLSYNVMPGWASEKPLRDLMWLQSQLGGVPGDSTPRQIERALNYAHRLQQGRAAYFEHHPRAGPLLEEMHHDNVHVVAHEYFNRDWHIGYFADLAHSLEAAGLQFACSVHKSDLVGEVRQRAMACGLTDSQMNTALRETTHDFILNRRFRRDLFVRGSRRLRPDDRNERLLHTAFVLAQPASKVSASVVTPYGAVTLDASLLAPLLQALEAAETALPLSELMKRAHLPARALAEAVQVLAALVAQGHVWPVFGDDQQWVAQTRAHAINREIMADARHADVLRYLASPLTGHAIESTRADRLLGDAWAQGAHGAQALADIALQAAPAYWQDLTGQAVADPAAGIPAQGSGAAHQARAQAQHFIESVLPLWQRLGILV